jgi:predicted outer membrane lipoprotein
MVWLVRLYPKRWRARYGGELEQLVRDLQPGGFRLALDLVRGAVGLHLRQGIEMNVAQRRSLALTAAIAGVVGLGLSVEILLSNVVFPSKTDDDLIPVLVSYLCVFAAQFLAGFVTARAGAGRWTQVAAGLLAGVIIGLLVAASFAIVDNVWLDVVAQQPNKIDGFAHSGAASMRDYINDGLVGVAVGLPVGLGLFGALFGLAGGLAGDRRAPSSTARRT